MNILFCLFLAAATAYNIDRNKYSVITIGNMTIHVPKVKSSKLKQLAISNPALKVIGGVAFMNEIDDCRAKYRKNKNATEFYRNLYCSLIQHQFSIAQGNPCNLTQALARKFNDKLADFVMFKKFVKSPTACERKISNSKRRSMNIDPINNSELIKERLKSPKKNYIYLGPTIFPISTVTSRILFVMDTNDSTNRYEDKNKKEKPELRVEFVE